MPYPKPSYDGQDEAPDRPPRLKILERTAALMLQNAPKYRLKPRLRMTRVEQPFEVFGITGEAGDYIALDPQGTVSVISEEEQSRDWEPVSRKNLPA